jgi:sialate O-acetylesterase
MKILSPLAILVFMGCLNTTAQIRLPRLISNGMILQRADTLKLWGWAAAGEQVKLSFDHQSYTVQASEKGEWEIKLPPHKAGGPYEMVFSGTNTIRLNDILFGDVWLCSGQSNMELPMGRLIDKYPDVIAAAGNKNIRQFIVPDEYDFKAPRKDLSAGSWESANPKSVLNFSGVAYFFALDIYKKRQVPVGLINSALGGSPAQSWISEKALMKFPQLLKETQRFKNDSLIKAIETADQQASIQWRKALESSDEGLKKKWQTAAADQSWSTMQIPGYWANEPIGPVNGVMWFKKEIELPSSMTGKPAKLLLGRIVGADSTFVNGKFVGAITYEYPPRRYLFDAGILQPGKNEITVRLVNSGGKGGFVPDKPYELIAGTDTIHLTGAWKYQLGAQMEPAPGQTFVRWKPAGLYNAMIAPLQNYKIKGVLWYQGEANTYDSKAYGELMKSLMADWRNTWHKSRLPFLIVQLPEFMEAKELPSESKWAETRAVQQKLGTLPDAATVVTLGLGEWNDIHPLSKADVGHRLALQAESLVYGNKAVVASGPVLKSVAAKQGKLILSFSDTGSGLIAKGGPPLKTFAVAGADQRYVWAKAIISGHTVVVWNEAIPQPEYVRYAWADYPEGANLYNKEGLPASPFEAAVTKK